MRTMAPAPATPRAGPPTPGRAPGPSARWRRSAGRARPGPAAPKAPTHRAGTDRPGPGRSRPGPAPPGPAELHRHPGDGRPRARPELGPGRRDRVAAGRCRSGRSSPTPVTTARPGRPRAVDRSTCTRTGSRTRVAGSTSGTELPGSTAPRPGGRRPGRRRPARRRSPVGRHRSPPRPPDRGRWPARTPPRRPAQRKPADRCPDPPATDGPPGRGPRRRPTATARRSGAHPGVDDGQDHAGHRGAGADADQHGGAGGHVEGRDLVGEVDHRHRGASRWSTAWTTPTNSSAVP